MKRLPIALLALSSAAAAAQPVAVVPLDLKPGLWELSRTVVVLPIGMRGMAPEARQKLADAIRRQDPPPRLVRQDWQRCLSAAELQEAFRPADEAQCRYTVLNSGATSLELAVQCEADDKRPRRDGRFTLAAESAERVQGDLDLDVGEGVQASTLQMRVTGRWAGADCAADAAPPGKPQGR